MNKYSVKGVFRWFFKENGETAQFEERLIYVEANSFDHALDLAEKEAEEYCLNDEKANFVIESLGRFRAYEIIDNIEPETEIYSERFESSLSVEEFLNRLNKKE